MGNFVASAAAAAQKGAAAVAAVLGKTILGRALTLAARTCDVRTARTESGMLFSRFRLWADGGQLHVQSNDSEDATHVRLSAPGAYFPPILVDARDLKQLIAKLPRGAEVSMLPDGDMLGVSGGAGVTTRLPAIPVDAGAGNDLPWPAPSGEGDGHCLIGADALSAALEHTAYAQAVMEVRYYLNGSCWERSAGGNWLKVVATDAHRLAMCEFAVDGELHPNAEESAVKQNIVRRPATLQVQRVLKGVKDNAPIRVTFADAHAVFELPGVTVISKLIDGKYPDFNRVIPAVAKCPIVARVDAESIVAQLEAVMATAHHKYHGVRLELDADRGGIEFRASNAEGAESTTFVGAAIRGLKGKQFAIGFNGRYLLDYFRRESGSVDMHMSGSDCSVLLSPANTGHQRRAVIMSMRL